MRAREVFEFVKPFDNGGYGPGDDGTGLEVWKEFSTLCTAAIQRIPNVDVEEDDFISLSKPLQHSLGVIYINNGFTPRAKKIMATNGDEEFPDGHGPNFTLDIYPTMVSKPRKKYNSDTYYIEPDYRRWCQCYAELYCYPFNIKDIERQFKFNIIGGQDTYNRVKFILDIVNRCYALCQ